MAQLPDIPRGGLRKEDMPGAPDWIEPLLRFANLLLGAVRAMASNLTLTDNLAAEVVTANFSHGVPQLVSLKKLTAAKGVLALSVGSADGKIQHMLSGPLHLSGTTTAGNVKVTASFADTTAVRVPVTMMLTPEGSYSALTPSSGTWTAPTLLNAYTNLGGIYMTAGYFKDANGFVHLRGIVTNAGALAANVPVFTLPAGYRPSAQVIYNPYCSLGTTPAAGVTTAGNVQITVAVGAGVVLSLDGITFDTR